MFFKKKKAFVFYRKKETNTGLFWHDSLLSELSLQVKICKVLTKITMVTKQTRFQIKDVSVPRPPNERFSIDMLMTAENLKFQKHFSEAMHSGFHEHDT